ncbi:GGDEF domain-containing response regulator [Tengunoibacter tsumagoiensis]|uniref:Diguanylate cyclase response regulator n=1 Tax=Tengunoibacter tsumagoiensis TaxID=2014871 RepID=A0A402A220_9CHLR|nr:diguanylate cyclase [Tengunoibacter tsumagoiensis]GCE13197.1 hypothetical protein KTT_30560 [Tengunoibacter tsumagoiensis]
MPSILVLENDGWITNVINDHLKGEDYQAVMACTDEDAVQFAFRETPCLILLDATLENANCLRMVQRLRDHPKCMHIPIIMVGATTPNTLAEKVCAYEAGVDSYLCKPLILEELLVQVQRQIQRLQQHMLSPLTRLPGGLQLERAIEQKVKNVVPWSVLYLDLDNFKAFNDVYGFLAGNNMILLVGNICQRMVYEYGNPEDFVGHVGGDDFVIVSTPEREKMLCRQILSHYNEESAVLYRREDLERGTISGVDRKGRPYQFPLVSLSIGVVSDHLCCSHTADEVGTLTAEAKRLAKQSSNNISHISLEWGKKYLQSFSSQSPPSFHFANHAGRNPFRLPEEGIVAEYK